MNSDRMTDIETKNDRAGGGHAITAFILFLICFIASTAGAIAGFGGGVIIKPASDMFGLLPVATTSFLSGCTALAMAVSTLIRSRRSSVKLNLKVSTPLAIGAVLGGFVGKKLFELVRNASADQNLLGGVQAICLTVITIFVFIYICTKDRLPSFHVKNLAAILVIGLLLGVISSFLGIGGGTSNVAVLFLFFSMNAKEAARNSIYIIMFSQISSIVTAVATQSVPPFTVPALICMAGGGVAGAVVGSYFYKKMSVSAVETLLKVLLVGIIMIDFYNIFKFF